MILVSHLRQMYLHSDFSKHNQKSVAAGSVPGMTATDYTDVVLALPHTFPTHLTSVILPASCLRSPSVLWFGKNTSPFYSLHASQEGYLGF